MNTRAKTIALAVFMAFLVNIAVPFSPLQAASFSNPGLLPSNPFYFVKEWGRSLRGAFVFSEKRRLELNIEILDEKAAEIDKLSRLLSSDSAILAVAVDNYGDSLIDVEKNTGVFDQALADNLTVKLIRHLQVLDVLSASPKILEMEARVFDLLAFLLEEFYTEQSFQQLFQKTNTLRTAEALDILESHLVDSDNLYKIYRLKSDMLLDFGGGVMALESSDLPLDEVRGDLITRLRALDDLRLKVEDPELKNRINLLRQNVLKAVEDKKLIDSEVVDTVLTEVEVIVENLRLNLKESGNVSALVKKLFVQSQFHKNQAERFYDAEQYSASFGQATLALAVARQAWYFQLAPAIKNSYLFELNLIKSEYDQLLIDEKSLESRIIGLSDFIKNGGIVRPNERVEKELIEIRLLLAKLKYLQ